MQTEANTDLPTKKKNSLSQGSEYTFDLKLNCVVNCAKSVSKASKNKTAQIMHTLFVLKQHPPHSLSSLSLVNRTHTHAIDLSVQTTEQFPGKSTNEWVVIGV